MEFSRTHVAIAAAAGGLLLMLFLGSLMWLSRQGPVLSRSEEKDPLSGLPVSVTFNPLRDRTVERVATKFIRAMRDGRCREQLADWERDYRKKYAAFICASEDQHPLLSWDLVEWEDRPPLVILHYSGKRRNSPGQKGTYHELFSVTTEREDRQWVVTKYDAMY
jgi:hypothetical protein